MWNSNCGHWTTTSSDILELKQMQVEATRQCARASAAKGVSSRYLANVPLALLPLLPAAPPPPPAPSPASLSSAASSSSSSRASSPPPSASGLTPASFGLALAEACLNKTRCADAGPKGSSSCFASSSSSHFLALTQTPSPPVTPPRPLITSIPPPPPRRSFAFVPLLDASSSSSSASPSPALSPNSSTSSTSSYLTSNVKAAANSILPRSPPSKAGPSAPSYFSNPGAYGAYTPPPPSFVGGNATLGLERKLGFTFESDTEADVVESDEEDRAWPHDWPGQRHHHHKVQKQQPLSPITEHSSRKPPEPGNARAGITKPQPNSMTLPPSPPAEPCALPAVRTSPVRSSSPGSPTQMRSCSPSAESPTSARKKTMPLVLLA